jgi:hypothetical protein
MGRRARNRVIDPIRLLPAFFVRSIRWRTFRNLCPRMARITTNEGQNPTGWQTISDRQVTFYASPKNTQRQASNRN